MTATTAFRCVVCDQHHYSRPGKGFYADDGHPYTPPTEGDNTVVIGGGYAHGNGPALFGALEKCGICRALIEPGDADAHHQFHTLVAEVAAIAWKLATAHDMGGGEAA